MLLYGLQYSSSACQNLLRGNVVLNFKYGKLILSFVLTYITSIYCSAHLYIGDEFSVFVYLKMSLFKSLHFEGDFCWT